MKKISKKCRELLEESQKFLPSYGAHHFTNHMTMALIALDQIGGEDKLEDFFTGYSKELRTFDVKSKVGVDEDQLLEDLLDSDKSYEYIVSFLRQENKKVGLEELIRSVLVVVMPGIGSGAFHCQIRLAYAIESGYELEVISALAYWVSNYSTLGEPGKCGEKGITDLSRAALGRDFPLKEKHNSISSRMKEISEMESAELCRIIPHDLSLQNLASLALEIYSQSDDNFTCLHLVTSVHALRIVLPYCKDQEKVLEYYYIAMVFAIISVGTSLDTKPLKYGGDNHSVESLCKIAIESSDDHTIKLAYSCREEYKEYGHDGYKNALEFRLKKEKGLIKGTIIGGRYIL